MILEENNFKKNFFIKLECLENFCLKYRLKIYLFLLLLLLVVQFFFWKKNIEVRAFLDIVEAPPSENTLKAFSFGDDEFYYRLKAFKVQNMGDTYGRFTSFYKYDYEKLYGWFNLLEKLDSESNYLPSLVAYYYSAVPRANKKLYTVKFLKNHAFINPKKNWWWLYQAMYIAYYGMKDEDLGIDLARKLKETSPDTAPIWTKQMVAILLAKNGNECEAVRIINELLIEYDRSDRTKEEKEAEMNYMKYFLINNIRMLEQKNFDVYKCLNQGGQNE